ncbi:MAG TPA: HAMP domain-containing sensor histidine kinase [Devosia sp.]|nr:HAMP domain-containing sensor histidine kinase [Devosia sp.]
MAPARAPQKWRPTLAMIVFAVLLTVLALPAAIVIWFRALDNTTSRMGSTEIGALAVALVLTVLIAVVFSRTITGPINALVRRTEEIGRGGRAAIEAPDQLGTREIATLSQSFLDLAERLVDRTEYVSSFAAHVSHELKSPVTAIRGSAELLRDAEMSKAERDRFLDHIIADSDRLASLLERLRELARADLDFASGITTIAEAVGDEPIVTLEGAVDVKVALGLEAARAVFGQLLRNAAEHGATRVTISAARDEGVLRVTVADNGTGISAGNRDRVFEPFFTTRREAGGTGMGLQIVRSMLAAHGGAIQLLPSDAGAVFEIRVPLAAL